MIDRWSVTESGLDIKYDSQGNIIVSGYYEGNALFGENNEITLTYNSSFYNLFIAKYNPIGQLIWVKYPTGTGSSKGNGIAIDNEDNIIMTGVFCGQKIFGYGEPNQTTLYCPVMWDFFIAKYDSSGDLIWVNQEGNPPGSTSFEGLNVAISDNDIYVTGRFRGEFIFSSGNPNVDTLFCDGNWDDIFFSKI
ncbi:MAG: hypothetical protein COX07_01445 [Bacteroidetes bacterium CG23_combo_of_CG06-09_8_20_14_all_32_9]|nr:MAG: hypothetical protein COX07_01445 [Bacteroidetes bacterium CG23_combo_of_CG06-09_8_20_14_all_32_9]